MRVPRPTSVNQLSIFKRDQLAPPRHVSGNERRRVNPNRGVIKLSERYADIFFPLRLSPFPPYLESLLLGP